MTGTRRRVLRATDLWKFAVCEQKAVFEREYGEELTAEARERIVDGNSGHARFLAQAFASDPRVRSSESKPWCFVASCLFGPAAPETNVLRALRDQVLRRHRSGRALIRLYYRASPALVRLLDRHPWARPLMRLLLRPAVVVSAWIVKEPR